MPDDLAITLEQGTPEIVEFGKEVLMRVPLMADGKEIGDIIFALEHKEAQ